MYGININQTLYSTIRLKPGAYKVYFMNSLNLQISNGENVISGNVTIGVKNPKQNINWFLYGGGIRIKTIKDSDRVAYQAVKGFKYNLENPGIVPADLPPALSLSHPNGIPAYSLAFSSGSFDGIASLIKKYSISVQPIFNQFFIPATDSPVIDYDVEEKQSELDVQLARGSFIGYKNVFEYVYPNNSELQGAIFKSKIKRSFDSAIDFPSTFYSPPSALPVISEEYKHGNLRKIEYFNASLGLVLSEDFKYNYDSSEIRTLSAKNFYAVGNENFFSGFCQQVRVLFTSWHNLKSNFISAAQYETTCDGTSSLLPQLFLDLDKSSCLLNLAGAFVCVDDFRHKVQVTEHIKKEYFPGGTIIHQENYAYRDNYKRLFSKISVLPSGETLENRYYYSQDPEMASAPMRNELAARNMVSMPLREEYYRNGGLLSSSETRYGSFTPAGSVQPGYVLPQYIYAGKGNSLERKAIFSSYDDKGNILEQAPENGVSASFIWGFRKSLPVAKIENMAYSSIPANLILAVQAASDAVPYSEQNLLAALEALRTSPALSGAIATTYTYKPLIGPSTVTDSKGMKTSYEYDSFGRLESVRGNEGSILSENKYHYRPQN